MKLRNFMTDEQSADVSFRVGTSTCQPGVEAPRTLKNFASSGKTSDFGVFHSPLRPTEIVP